MANEGDTLREDILAAAEEVENEVEEPAEEKATEETTEEIPQETTGEEEPAGEPEPADPPVEPQPQTGPKPPVDWPEEVQQAWNDLPEGVRNEVARRESEINETLRETAGIRQEYNDFTQMLQPYIPLMSAEGVQPMQAIEGLMKTTAALQMGSPQQKAQRIAGLINHYGIDIELLDSILAGQPVADPAEDRLQQMLDQRLAPVNQLMGEIQSAKQHQQDALHEEAGQDINNFATDGKHPYFDQVRLVMADFLDMAASRGQEMSLEEAYQRACMSDPQIAPEYTKQFQQQNAGMVDKQNAAVSLPGGGGSGAAVTDEEMSLRDTIAAQFGQADRI